MAIAHATTAGTLRAELADADAEVEALQAALAQALQEAAEAHQAGAAVLSALEINMAPLMADLAVARRVRAAAEGGLLPTAPGLRISVDGDSHGLGPEAEIQHLKLDINHYQHQAEQAKVEEKQRAHELERVKAEIVETDNALAYERRRVKHVATTELSQGWAGMGPQGLGRRTMAVRAEVKMREHAEQRTTRLTRESHKLAHDTVWQQSNMAQISDRMARVKKALDQKEKQLLKVAKHNKQMEAKLAAVQTRPTACSEDLESVADSATEGPKRQRQGSRTSSASSASTGRLPQLYQ